MKPAAPQWISEFPRAATLSWYGNIRTKRSLLVGAWLEQIRSACGVFEWLTLSYLGVINLFVVAGHKNLAHASRYLLIHQAVGLAILALALTAQRWPNPGLRFARHWYPLPLYVYFFEELEGLVHAIFPGWFDGWMISFDYALTGVHPSVWLARFATPALNDFMQAAYMTYFLYLIILPAILYARGERRAFWAVMVSTAMAHYAVYVIAILLPIESPYYSLAAFQHVSLAGGFSTRLINLIERFGRVHGAAFPSAHVAGSMVAMLGAWRYRRWLFWACLPFFVSMMVATVYGRYHYIADALAGLVTGVIGYAAGHWLIEGRGALPAKSGQRISGCSTRI